MDGVSPLPRDVLLLAEGTLAEFPLGGSRKRVVDPRFVWSALDCPRSGDVLISAEPGVEFADWGGHDHVGGGSHGSLHATDSLGALLWCGTGPASRAQREQWSLRDVAGIVRDHFGTAD